MEVTLNPTEGAAAKQQPDATVVTDSRGRKLTIKTLDVLYESRVARFVGGEAASNTTYMLGYVFPAISVVGIDGEELPLPQSQREIDFAIQRLGREGIAAVMRHIEDQARAGTEEAAVKNSGGTPDSSKPAGS